VGSGALEEQASPVDLSHSLWVMLPDHNVLKRNFFKFDYQMLGHSQIMNIRTKISFATLFHKRLIDWLLSVLHPAQEYYTYMYMETSPFNTSEGLQNLGLCSTLRAFEQGGIFFVPHLLWHGTSVFSGLIWRTAPFRRLLRHTRGCGGPIVTRIPFQSPLMTHKGMWRTYSNPDPHGSFFKAWKETSISRCTEGWMADIFLNVCNRRFWYPFWTLSTLKK
jgi:hypothetical protein